jgi:thioredoxin reductase
MNVREWDVVIAGAGPAGLSAALILGRACRRVLLADTGTPRSWASKAMYGFLSRDGIAPGKFREIAHDELARYPNVTFLKSEVIQARRRSDEGFEVTLRPRRKVRCRKLLIATGVFDQLPAIERVEEFFGQSVFQCPYCDGWELRDKAIAVYGKGQRGFEMSRAMTAWSRTITLCTDGRAGLTQIEREQLTANGIELMEDRIEGLVGQKGRLDHIAFRNGRTLPCAALFFDMPSHEQSHLAQSVGCQFTSNGGIKCGRYEATSVPGVFVAGNIIKDVQLSIVAAAEGARAAFGINKALTREDFQRRAGA